MMAITTSNSISVKAKFRFLGWPALKFISLIYHFGAGKAFLQWIAKD